MTRAELELLLPGLLSAEYEITSDASRRYNCIAWAVGDTQHWWDSLPVSGYYWPPGAPSADTLAGWLRVFELHQYRACDTGDHEPGYEKVAVYVDPQGFPSHVARQLESGEWTSKLGPDEDIRHVTPAALEGEIYGQVVQYMRRRPSAGALGAATGAPALPSR